MTRHPGSFTKSEVFLRLFRKRIRIHFLFLDKMQEDLICLYHDLNFTTWFVSIKNNINLTNLDFNQFQLKQIINDLISSIVFSCMIQIICDRNIRKIGNCQITSGDYRA